MLTSDLSSGVGQVTPKRDFHCTRTSYHVLYMHIWLSIGAAIAVAFTDTALLMKVVVATVMVEVVMAGDNRRGGGGSSGEHIINWLESLFFDFDIYRCLMNS